MLLERRKFLGHSLVSKTYAWQSMSAELPHHGLVLLTVPGCSEKDDLVIINDRDIRFFKMTL